MAGPAQTIPGQTGRVDELLHLAGGHPRAAMTRCRAILAAAPAPYEASVARQAQGIVLRDFGDMDAAIAELRAALKLARATSSRHREADVLATLGAALVQAGHSSRGLAAFDASLALTAGPVAGQVLVRRAINLWILGRYPEALADLRRALRLLRAGNDVRWLARALTTRALVHLACGSASQAQLDLDRAERMFAATSQELECAYVWHNRGLIAFRSGDVPGALSCLDQADQQYRQLGVVMPELAIDRCHALLAAGLPADALRETDTARVRLPRGSKPTTTADLLLMAARAALAASEPETAATRASAAQAMFRAQGRAWQQAHARLLLLQARHATAAPSGRLLGQAEQVAATLELLGSADAPQARLFAGRIAAALGRPVIADTQFALAARARHRQTPPLARVNGWLAEALRAEAAGNRRRVLAACRAGFAALDQHQLIFGASELRVHATSQGAELARLAQRTALASARPRTLLAWSERWRATAALLPPSRPADDRELQADLTALRDVTSRLARVTADGEQVRSLKREQSRLERAVGARSQRAQGLREPTRLAFRLETLLAELGRTRLVHIADIDGHLYPLVCDGGRVRQFLAGRTEDAVRDLGYARFSMRRLARARGTDDASALAALRALGARLDSLLIGPAARYLGQGPVVVVPPGKFHGIPWSLLPSFRDRPVSIAPSASAWLLARRTAQPPSRPPVLVSGPGLAGGDREVKQLADAYRTVTVLGSGTATAAAVLQALDGAGLAHIAAHGTFRPDSPLFSALHLDDGPLTVHDLERLHRAPYRIILSCCDSGVLAPVGADELIGIAAALAPRGTAGLLASVVPVNDQAATDLMLAVHEQLRHGRTLAEALCAARASTEGDPIATVTGWSFITLGAA